MYCQHFGFREDPFGVSPDDRFFFAGSQHAEASAALYYAIAQRRGFAVLIAPPGLGKSTVLVNLTARIASEARVAFFVHPRFESASVLGSVLLAMGLEPEPDAVRRHRQLYAFLLDLLGRSKTCVVVFDEAQNLTAESLETIRMLSNFETPSQKLIQFVLAGQPGLANLLRAPECEQTLQRVNIVARLQPLSATEIEQYIAHRLKVAGAPCNPFSASAVRAIATATKGVPRIVNTICFNALTLAFAVGKRTVDAADIAEVLKDLSLGEPRPASAPVQRRNKWRLPQARLRIRLPKNAPRASVRPFFLAAAVFAFTLACAALITR